MATDEELIALTEELEAGLREDVDAALALTAKDFADEVARSTELVAAAFSVSRIRDMWRARVPGLMAAVRRIARRGATEAAGGVGDPVPDADALNPALDAHLAEVRERLNGVGDRLAEAARTELAEGLAAGETQAQLQARLTAAFATDAAQLGTGRALRIARTEATAAFNAGALAAAEVLTGPERPLVKQWLSRRDDRTRQTHYDANGQLRFLDEAFRVGVSDMRFPGDPLGPADETINCRCIMKTAAARTEGSDVDGDNLSAAAGAHTGGMIALIPSAADAERLALDGGEPVGELHLTLRFLGDAVDWSEDQRAELLLAVQRASSWLTPVDAFAFGVAQWNPHGDEPSWVYNVGDADKENPQLIGVHSEVAYQVCDRGFPEPAQHSPWSPHICAVYGTDSPRTVMVERTGPVRFDRIRVAFGGEHTDFPLLTEPVGIQDTEDEPEYMDSEEEVSMPTAPPTVTWSTPGDTALAFESEQTGDGRVFAAGALYWDGDGPWALQYADRMNGGHDGAQLAGAINGIVRTGGRIAGHGLLYLTQQAGAEAALLLAQNAPLGVSVDLDDVDVEFVSLLPVAEGDPVDGYSAKLITASVMPLPDGGWQVTGETVPQLSASGSSAVALSRKVSLMVGEDGRVPAEAVTLTAAAGDPDGPAGEVVHRESAGDFLMRITRGRVRGATLVTLPAFSEARIVLDEEVFASATEDEVTAAIKSSSDYDRVLRHVRSSRVPVGAARAAQFLKMPVVAAQRLLSQAAMRGEVVRLTRGLYTDKSTSARADHVMPNDMAGSPNGEPDTLAAAVTGAVDLPVADRDRSWDGDAAMDRVFEWADGDGDKVQQAFAYHEDGKPPFVKGGYKLGYADVIDGDLTIIPKGVSAAIGALNGARGGVDLPAEERPKVEDKLERVRAHVSETLNDTEDAALEASAWTAMRDEDPMPAAWFREPTAEELPPGGPGVNYKDGRIFGWVAQAGEPHAGFAKKITIDGLGKIDTSHFLRQRFTLDDGSTVKAGAYTMNVGHHRDGAECETSACQFDDTRTVAGIVTVGMSARGMWFSGAAAPWLSEWDRKVFKATQPSYHMKKGASGRWELRAVLGVPVPGHSSPLLASAVVERTQMALTAAATMAEVEAASAAVDDAQQVAVDGYEQSGDGSQSLAELVAAAVDAALDKREARKAAEAAELAELVAMAGTLDIDTTGPEGA